MDPPTIACEQQQKAPFICVVDGLGWANVAIKGGVPRGGQTATWPARGWERSSSGRRTGLSKATEPMAHK